MVILSTDDGFYKIGTKNGILTFFHHYITYLYAKNQIFQCKELLNYYIISMMYQMSEYRNNMTEYSKSINRKTRIYFLFL